MKRRRREPPDIGRANALFADPLQPLFKSLYGGSKKSPSEPPKGAYLRGLSVNLTQLEENLLKQAMGESYVVSVLHRDPLWDSALGVLAEDTVLQTVLDEIRKGFNFEYAVDAKVTESLTEIKFAPCVVNLARAVGRTVNRDLLYFHLSEMYYRFVVWIFCAGFVPIAYLEASELELSEQASLVDLAQVRAKTQELERQFDAFERVKLTPERVRSTMKELGLASNSVMRDLTQKLKEVSESEEVTPAEFNQVGLTMMEIMRRFARGHHIYVPRFDETVKCFYSHSSGELLVITPEKPRMRYSCFSMMKPKLIPVSEDSEDVPPAVLLHSVVATGADDSKMYRKLRADFFSATSINSKRSVLAAPAPNDDGESKQRQNAREYLETVSQSFPFQVYNDMVKQNQTKDASAAQNVVGNLNAKNLASGPYAGPSLLHNTPSAFIDSYESHMKAKVMEDIRKMLSGYREMDANYTALEKFLKAAEYDDLHGMMKAFPDLSERDKSLCKKYLQDISYVKTDRPEIHTLTEPMKLIANYTATVGLADIEELFHLWTVMWETKFTSSNLYTRRKNNIQYSNPDAMHTEPTPAINKFFAHLVNVPGDTVKYVPGARPNFNELSYLMNLIDTSTTGVRQMVAKSLHLLPSAIIFTQPEEEDSESDDEDKESQKPAVAKSNAVK